VIKINSFLFFLQLLVPALGAKGAGDLPHDAPLSGPLGLSFLVQALGYILSLVSLNRSHCRNCLFDVVLL